MWRPNISNRSFDRMGERYAHLIDPYHFLGRSALEWPHNKQFVPPVNFRKSDQLFVLEIAIPGFTKEEIEITVNDDILKVRGEKAQKEPSPDKELILEEFNYDAFERSFKLATGLGHEKIKASLQSGILSLEFIDVPEAEEKMYQKIPVQ